MVLHIHRVSLPARWRPPYLPEPPGAEGLSLLQTNCRFSKSKTPQDGGQGEIKVSMQSAMDAFEWIDGHFFLPVYTISPQIKLHPASQRWADLPIWTPGRPCDTLVIYMDGSYISQTECAGLAVAAFVSAEGTWYQAGMISSKLGKADS